MYELIAISECKEHSGPNYKPVGSSYGHYGNLNGAYRNAHTFNNGCECRVEVRVNKQGKQ